MNLHETIDRILAWTPRMKVVAVVIILAMIAGIFAFVFHLGVSYGDGWASSRYIEERDKRLAEIERYRKNEAEFAAENSLLRKQNEATAQILAQKDKTAAADDARRFTELAAERQKQYAEIDLDNDYDRQLCGLCADAIRAGHELSADLCGRCKAAPKGDR